MPYVPNADIMKELVAQFAKDPAFKTAFEEAFRNALQMKIPQLVENNINSFDDYLKFYEDTLTWTPSEIADGKNVYYRICLFYLVIDFPHIRQYQTAIDPGNGEFPSVVQVTHKKPGDMWTWLSRWVVNYAKKVGEFMNTQGSLTSENLKTFYASPSYHMEDYPIPTGGWKSFNHFFARDIDPKVRPIDYPDHPNVIVSPADSKFGGWWPVNSDGEVIIKGLPWSIDQLLEGNDYAAKFKNGIFTHAVLGPSDYHGQHASVAGRVLQANVVDGLCYLKVETEADEDGVHRLSMRRHLEAPDAPGYQFSQARGIIVIDTEHYGDFGLVAICPIGMAQVSSVVMADKLKVDLKKHVVNVEKGENISHFQMGGSDHVLIFQNPGVTVGATTGTYYNVGKNIAMFPPKQ